ncbi:DOMON-like domain-containing protein [Sphingomonas endolithica]|uniref:DOMON-like domain-containing protein n=1 Tax=Sphingomonas endolithica TaxID=2972485 RepID=UPI0021AF2E7F|nr:DOMON-like domain-containing protein [Sphingomonas sp. ZFBP2030]
MRYILHPHPDTPPARVRGVVVDLVATATGLLLTFIVEGGDALLLPEAKSPLRAGGLWKTTCFELFLAPGGSESYLEFNYAPSTEWAAYGFDSYRAGMRDLPQIAPPHIARGGPDAGYIIEVDQELDDIPPGPCHIGLSAVIEEVDGTKSYWALAHAPGPPDFHNRDCFTGRLPASEQ